MGALSAVQGALLPGDELILSSCLPVHPERQDRALCGGTLRGGPSLFRAVLWLVGSGEACRTVGNSGPTGEQGGTTAYKEQMVSAWVSHCGLKAQGQERLAAVSLQTCPAKSAGQE